MNQEQIGKWIALLRKEKRMTQEQLAERLGVSNRSVSRWENGRCMPDFSLLWDIADELDVSVSELLNGKRTEGDMLGRRRVCCFCGDRRRILQKWATDDVACGFGSYGKKGCSLAGIG